MNQNTQVKTILILAANPGSTSRLRLDREVREIEEGLRRANEREQFKLEQKWAVRLRDFYRAILDYRPHIVHFSGHGAGKDGIVLEDDTGEAALITADGLSSMFALFATKGVECVVLNACYSEEQAQAISQHIKCVIGMKQAVGDKAAIAFAVAFYDAIAAGEEVEFAYKLGCSQMLSFVEHQTPIFLQKEHMAVPIMLHTHVIPPNPYQGLAAFGEEDAGFFFGRETFIDGLLEAVHKQPLVGVIGPSGSGKSSVVFAGLIPLLRKEGNWLIESFRPGNQPFYQLASVLVRQLEPEVGETKQLREAAGLAKDMQQGTVSLQQVVSRIIERNPGKQLLLVADQFEELYTLCQTREEQQLFADTLLSAIAQKSLTLVFTLRADFYGYVLSYRPFRDALQQFIPQLLSSMNREELTAAIEQPAHKLEVELEAQLTQRILDDVGREPGNLPLLEFTLTRLWSLQQDRVLTHRAYDEIGGVKKALANHAEQIYQQLTEVEQKLAQRIFVQLVCPGEGTEDTRRIATRAEVGENNWKLVSHLAGYKARLVVTGHDDKSGEDIVEVVHEALIREWFTLQTWMNANRQFRVWQERLKVALREWKNSNHDPGALLRGVPLGIAEDWLQKRSNDITQEERDFIQASAQQRDREQEEIERRKRLIFSGLAIGLIGALSLSGFALWQWRQAEITKSNILSRSSDIFFSQGKEFDALIESLRAGVILRSVKAQPSIEMVSALSQAVSHVKERNRIKAHDNTVTRVVFSPDGKAIASSGADSKIKFWNTNGKKLKILNGHTNGVTSVVFNSDGKMLASASWDRTVKLWNTNGKELKTLTGHIDAVIDVSFSPTGKMLASASWDKTVKLWDTNGKELKTLTGHSDKVNSVSFSANGEMLASADEKGTIKLWDTKGKELKTLIGHNKGVSRVVFSPDNKMLASTSWDKTVKIWDISGKELKTLTGHISDVNDVVFSPDGKTLASASWDNKVKIWDISGKELKTLGGHSGGVMSVSFSPDGKTLTSGSFDRTIKFWDTSNKTLQTLNGHSGPVTSVHFSPDGQTLVSAGDDTTIQIWEISGKKLKTLTGHSDRITSVVFSPDGKTLASASRDKTVKLWDINGKELKTLTGHIDKVNSVIFSSDSKILASASDDKTVKIWNTNGKELKTLTGHIDKVNSVSFSPDGKTLASASSDNTVKLWDTNGKELKTFTGHSGGVFSIVFSPDNKMLASASTDNTLRLWDTNGKELKTLIGHGNGVYSVSFSPDGKTLISTSSDNTVKLWNKNGKELTTLARHSYEISNAAFSPNGKILASGWDNTVILWNFDFDDLWKSGCNWLNDYLEAHPDVLEELKACRS